MKRISHSSQALAIILMMVSFFHIQILNGAEKEIKVTGKSAKAEVKLLMESQKYEELKKIGDRWKNLEAKEKKQIALELLKRLNSKRKLSLAPDAGVSVFYPVTQNGKRPKEGQILQDVYLEAGRSAWVLEQLFHFHIPQFHRTMNEKELAKASRTTMLAVIQMMQLPDFMNLTNASVEQRARAARSLQTPIEVLGLLAKDPDPKVRLGVAKHRMMVWVTDHILLEKDMNLEVRKAAIKNSIPARTGREIRKYRQKFNFLSNVPE